RDPARRAHRDRLSRERSLAIQFRDGAHPPGLQGTLRSPERAIRPASIRHGRRSCHAARSWMKLGCPETTIQSGGPMAASRSKNPVKVRASSKRAGAQTASAKRSAAKGERTPGDLVIPPLLKPVVDAFVKTKGVTVEKGWGSNSVALKTRGKIFAMLVRGD